MVFVLFFLCSQLLQLFRRMLQSCRNVSWSTKLHLSLHPTEGVQIKTESLFLWELIFNILHLNIDLSRSNQRLRWEVPTCFFIFRAESWLTTCAKVIIWTHCWTSTLVQFVHLSTFVRRPWELNKLRLGKKAHAIQKCVSSFCLWFLTLLHRWAFRATALVSFQTLVRLIYITKRQENTGSQVQTLKGSNLHTFTPPETPFTWSLSRSTQEKVQTPRAKSCRSNWSLFFYSSHRNTFLADQTGWAVEKLWWHI